MKPASLGVSNEARLMRPEFLMLSFGNTFNAKLIWNNVPTKLNFIVYLLMWDSHTCVKKHLTVVISTLLKKELSNFQLCY